MERRMVEAERCLREGLEGSPYVSELADIFGIEKEELIKRGVEIGMIMLTTPTKTEAVEKIFSEYNLTEKSIIDIHLYSLISMVFFAARMRLEQRGDLEGANSITP